MTTKEFIDITWMDLVNEDVISNLTMQQLRDGTWRRRSNVVHKLCLFLQCTAADLQATMVISPKHKLSQEAEKPEGAPVKRKRTKNTELPAAEESPKPWDPLQQAEKTERNHEKTEQDAVNPAHYQLSGFPEGFETIDVIAAVTADLMGMEAVCTANALKYLIRWKHKNGVEDLKKARWYLDRLIGEV